MELSNPPCRTVDSSAAVRFACAPFDVTVIALTAFFKGSSTFLVVASSFEIWTWMQTLQVNQISFSSVMEHSIRWKIFAVIKNLPAAAGIPISEADHTDLYFSIRDMTLASQDNTERGCAVG